MLRKVFDEKLRNKTFSLALGQIHFVQFGGAGGGAV